MVSEPVKKKLYTAAVFVAFILHSVACWAAITILVLFCWGGAEMYFTNAVRLTNVDCFIAVLLARPIMLAYVGNLADRMKKAKEESHG